MLKRLLLLVIAMSALLSAGYAVAQPVATGTLWFLARYDANGDGVLDQDDATGAFALDLSNPDAEAVALHAPGERIQHLSVAADGSRAGLIVQAEDDTFAAISVMADGARQVFPLPDAQNGLIERVSTRLWARADLGDSVALYGFGEAGDVVGPHLLPRAGIIYSIDPTGAYLSGYNINNGPMRLDRLEPLQPVEWTLLRTLAGVPAWSRMEARLAVPRNTEDGYTVEVFEVDGFFAWGTSIPVETPSGTTGLIVEWSPAGRYVVVTPVTNDMQAPLPLILIDVEASQTIMVASPDAQNAAVAWHPDDSEVLINRTITLGREFDSRLLRYVPATGQETMLSTVNGVVNVADAVWSTDGAQIALTGTTAFGNSLGVFTYEIATEALDTLLTYTDNTLTLGRVFWSSDSQSLIFRARQDDVMAELTGATHALFLLDIATREVRQLTDETLSPLSNGLVIR